MAGIEGIQGIRPNLPTQRTGGAGGPAMPKTNEADKPKPGFNDVLKAYVDGVDGQQKQAADAMKDLIAGKTSDVLPVVNAAAKADLSFKMLVGVRNKMIEAYKETMRMQI